MTVVIGRLPGSVAVVLATTAAALVGAPAAPAAAATCSSAHGVTVVVDFHELGGGVQTGCVADGGGDAASSLFRAAGFTLTYVNGQPFVCRVQGEPGADQEACVRTPPADAYWGLWWARNGSGWSYSSLGATSLRVPEGGSVAFSWNGSTTRSAPGIAPPQHATPTPSPSPSPTTRPTTRPTSTGGPTGGSTGGTTGGGTGGHPSPSSAPRASVVSATGGPTTAAPSRTPSPAISGRASSRPHRSDRAGSRSGSDQGRHPASRGSATPSSAASSAGVTTAPVAPTAAPRDPDGGLPAWVALVALGALAVGAAAAAVVRSRRTPGS